MNFDDFSIFVNTSDSFEDCWNPFFTLLKKNWRTSLPSIYLNTEKKNFTFPEIDINCTKVQEGDVRLSWSDCLRAGLAKVKTKYILYLQEDYFFDKEIKTDLIANFLNIIKVNSNVKCISLTDNGAVGPFLPTNNDKLWQVLNYTRYRIHTQASIWEKDTLEKFIVTGENGWMFEIYGTIRSTKYKDVFLTTNRDIFNYNHNPIISYVHTGIIKGKWHKGMVEVFNQNQITIDFSKRGFFESRSELKESLITLKKLSKNLKYFLPALILWLRKPSKNNSLLEPKSILYNLN